MRALKIIAIAVGGLVAVVVLALVAVVLFVDPNDYKDRITQAVKDSTGRSLSLPGELKLSVFPWLALQTGAASLGNPAGFGDEPFLTLKSARLRVKLLPLLLRRDLEVGRVEIDGLDLALRQNAAGKGNWEDWGSKESAADEAGKSSTGALKLAGIAITNSQVAFEDMEAQSMELRIGTVAAGVAIPVTMKLDLKTAADAKPMPLTAEFDLTLDVAAQRYGLAKLKLAGVLPGDGSSVALPWQFASPLLDLNLTAQTLAEAAFDAKVASAAVSGRVAGAKLIDAPALSGSFALAEIAPRAFLKDLGIEAPVTRDPSRLSRFAATGSFAWANDVARTDRLNVTLDDSVLTGRFAYDTRDSGMDFAMTVDKIDLDRYQPPPTSAAAPASGAKSEPIELPVDFLKPLRAQGTFKVGEIRIAGVQLADFSAGMNIRDGLARFAPLKARVYGGQYSGDITVDSRAAMPRLSLDEKLAGIDMAKLMKDFADTQRLSGRGTLIAKLTGQGRNSEALTRTLRGTISATLADGAVEGIDVWYAIAQAQSLIKKHALAPDANKKRTAFDTFAASADVVDGVATTRDLLVASQLLRVTGQGTTNLATTAIDYRITATVLKAPPGDQANMADLERVSIPVKITGSFDDPKIRPDLAGMAKERVKQEVEKKKEELKEKVQEKVKDKLRGLFGR
jgi:AsmA protein